MNTQAATELRAGSGIPSYRFEPTRGVVRSFATPQDVIDALDGDVESMIALVQSGGTTFLSPILGRLAGIIACDGTLRSHLAIVSREFEVPCLVGASLDLELADGIEVELVHENSERASILVTSVDHSGGDKPDVETAPPVVDLAEVHEQWWNYIRRVGDDIAVKDFDVDMSPEALASLIAEPLDDEHLNELVLHMGRTFKPEMTRRSGFTSELFPMLPYMCLSTIEDFHTYGERIRLIDAAMPAEQIGRHLAQRAGVASPLWTWMAAYHFLCGRECLIHLGKISPTDQRDDIRVVIDFWRRMALAQRGDGTLDNKDAGFTNRYLPSEEARSLIALAAPLPPDDAKALKRLNATAAGYSFLYFTDSRVGVYDSGPYPVGDGRQVAIIRDYVCLRPSDFAYPWAEGLDAPYDSISLVLRFSPDSFESFEINDWGTTFTEPDQLMSELTGAAVVATRPDGQRVEVPPEQWPSLSAELSATHVQLYQRFADMSREDRIFAATRMYCWGLKPFATIAGVVDDIDWAISPATLALYPDPLDDDDKAGAIFGSAVVANDMPGSFSPVI